MPGQLRHLLAAEAGHAAPGARRQPDVGRRQARPVRLRARRRGRVDPCAPGCRARHGWSAWDRRSQAAAGPGWPRRRDGPTLAAMTTTALITGANKGLGLETARQLADRGWTVLVGARDAERGRQPPRSWPPSGGDVRFVPLDVTDDASVAAAVDRGRRADRRTPRRPRQQRRHHRLRSPSPLDHRARRLPRLLRRQPAGTGAGDAGVPPAAASRPSCPAIVMVSSGLGSFARDGAIPTGSSRGCVPRLPVVEGRAEHGDHAVRQGAAGLEGQRRRPRLHGHRHERPLGPQDGRPRAPGPSWRWPPSAPTARPAASSTTRARCAGSRAASRRAGSGHSARAPLASQNSLRAPWTLKYQMNSRRSAAGTTGPPTGSRGSRGRCAGTSSRSRRGS